MYAGFKRAISYVLVPHRCRLCCAVMWRIWIGNLTFKTIQRRKLPEMTTYNHCVLRKFNTLARYSYPYTRPLRSCCHKFNQTYLITTPAPCLGSMQVPILTPDLCGSGALDSRVQSRVCATSVRPLQRHSIDTRVGCFARYWSSTIWWIWDRGVRINCGVVAKISVAIVRRKTWYKANWRSRPTANWKRRMTGGTSVITSALINPRQVWIVLRIHVEWGRSRTRMRWKIERLENWRIEFGVLYHCRRYHTWRKEVVTPQGFCDSYMAESIYVID